MPLTKHQYIDKYPIASSHRLLILGTIHPHDHRQFETSFFYGNKNSLWNILSDAFPKHLQRPFTLKDILGFLARFDIAVSDTILECRRVSHSALDENLIPKRFNHALIDQIKNSQIEHIFFTSGFQKNNAFKLFFQYILRQSIIPQNTRKYRLGTFDQNIFGRPIGFTILYSPSGRANAGIAKSRGYQLAKNKYSLSGRPVYDYTVDCYKAAFKSHFWSK